MKTFYIYLLGAILTLFPGYAFAYELNDTDANIIGHVTDKDTKEHLAYVTIMLKGTTIGTTTDETGHYFLKNLPEGTFTVEVSSIGYKTERRTVQLTKGKTLELNFEIGEDHVALEGVVVSANRNETTRRMAPTLVNVVSVKTFENTNSTCLAQGLNFQPGVTRNFAASLFRNIKYFTLRKLYLCRKWMQKRLQKTTTTGITLPNFDFLA